MAYLGEQSPYTDGMLEFDLWKFKNLVESRFFSARLNEDWVKIMVIQDWWKHQGEYFEVKKSRSLKQYTDDAFSWRGNRSWEYLK